MGFFSKFLGKNNEEKIKNDYNLENDEKTLLNVVPKVHNSEFGVLVDAINDLSKFADDTSKHTPLLLMAYAYARRSASAGVFLQGLIDSSNYEHVSKFFKAVQIQTIHTVEFQEEAARLAGEFLKSYHPALTKEIIAFITSMVATGLINDRYTGTSWMSFEYVMVESMNIMLKDQNFIHTHDEINILLKKHFVTQNEKNTTENTQDDTHFAKNTVNMIVNIITSRVSEKISNAQVARQFIFEELDAAQHGNAIARDFVKNSGFKHHQYNGAMENSIDEVDGPGGPQQTLLEDLFALKIPQDIMAEIRIKVVQNIIEIWLDDITNDDDIPF